MWDTQVVALLALNQNSALSLFLRGLYIQQIKHEWCDNSTLRIRTKNPSFVTRKILDAEMGAGRR